MVAFAAPSFGTGLISVLIGFLIVFIIYLLVIGFVLVGATRLSVVGETLLQDGLVGRVRGRDNGDSGWGRHFLPSRSVGIYGALWLP